MADPKRYLDLAGLQALTAKIKTRIAAAVTAEETRAKAAEEANAAAIAAEEAARKAQIGDLGKQPLAEGETEAKDQTVVGYVDAKVAEINGSADALEDRVEAVEALHATKEVEGETVFKTVGEEVSEAIAAVVADAPAKFDTLKEIADWIANSEDQSAADAEALVTTVDRLDGAVGTEGSVKYQIKAAVDALDATVDSAAVVQGTAATADAAAVASTQHVAVQVVEEDGVITEVTVTEADIASKVVLDEEIARAKAAEGDLQDAIDAEEAARKAQIGDLGKVGEGEDAVDQTVKGYVDTAVAEANGDITELEELIGDADDTAEDETVFGAIAAEAAARAAAIEALDADETSEDNGLCTVQVVEEAGVITGVTVVDKTSRITEAEIDACFEDEEEEAPEVNEEP